MRTHITHNKEHTTNNQQVNHNSKEVYMLLNIRKSKDSIEKKALIRWETRGKVALILEGSENNGEDTPICVRAHIIQIVTDKARNKRLNVYKIKQVTDSI